jgi:hypothetical protein
MKGFKSPHWAVRNSSMMVFASIIQRAVANDKNGESSAFAGRAVTITEFFQRFPTLYPFLLAELSEIASDVATLEPSTMNTVNIHPSLYPILLLLSKQKAVLRSESLNNISSATSSNLDVSKFVPLIESCSAKLFQSIRSMTAKALLPLIPIDQIPRKTVQLVSELLADISTSSSGSKREEGRGLVSLNMIHGKLFLIQEMTMNLNTL